MALEYKVLQFHYPDVGQKVHQHPDEDFVWVKDSAFAVFDGVTLAHQDPYPNPSPAAKAAEIAAKSAVETMIQSQKDGLTILLDAFIKANYEIKKLNKNLGLTAQTVNHLTKQYAATVGAFGFLRKDILFFGQINDCGVMVFDGVQQKFPLVDLLLDPQPAVGILTQWEQNGRFKPGSKEQHQAFRKEVVNNQDCEFNGIKIRFGVMTGENEAVQFFRYGAIKVLPGEIVLFYSDGFMEYIHNQEFIQLLRTTDSHEEIEAIIKAKFDQGLKFQKEKSLVVIKF